MFRRWLLQKTNPEYITYLSRTASVSTAMAQILINRGMKTPEEVTAFLTLGRAPLSDPFEIPGMSEALRAIEDARKHSARVFIHGDYDTDGLTATAIVLEALRRLGLEADFFIPNRFTHGYGFNPPAVALAEKAGAGLIITVDCGITSFEACREAASQGIDVIVTDHHEPSKEKDGFLLPEALSVINPKLANPAIADLAGAGVALKLVQALSLRYPDMVSFRDSMDLAALGILADSVPLTGENRVIVTEGMALINRGSRAGVRALKSVAGLEGRALRAELLAFTLVPRMNAAGRVSDASEVVELLVTGSEEQALDIARSLDRKNAERQKIEESICGEALGMLEHQEVGDAIVIAGDGWHEGVLGIVASRIAERFTRPAFVLSIRDGVARGSARSIPQFDVFGGLTRCKDLLLSYGGHRQAAGLRLRIADLDTFREKIARLVGEGVEDFTPTLTIEAEVDLREINFRFIDELSLLEPFGFGNPEPVLGAKGLEVIGPRVVGNNHLKMKLRSSTKAMDAIGFDMGKLYEAVENAGAVDAAFSATINEWEGGRSLQLTLKGLRPI